MLKKMRFRSSDQTFTDCFCVLFIQDFSVINTKLSNLCFGSYWSDAVFLQDTLRLISTKELNIFSIKAPL